MSDLAIVCMTKGERHAVAFLDAMRKDAHSVGARFVVVADNCDPYHRADQLVNVTSQGYFESAWDEALEHINAPYILRLDDDETLSLPLLTWLAAGEYRSGEVFAFARVHFWANHHQVIINPPLYPDLQTRLTTKERAGGRNVIHTGSPYGTGEIVPYPIEHHKFLVRNLEERRAIAAHYESIRPGAGMSDTYRPFNLPETCFDTLKLWDYKNGALTPR